MWMSRVQGDVLCDNDWGLIIHKPTAWYQTTYRFIVLYSMVILRQNVFAGWNLWAIWIFSHQSSPKIVVKHGWYHFEFPNKTFSSTVGADSQGYAVVRYSLFTSSGAISKIRKIYIYIGLLARRHEILHIMWDLLLSVIK